MSNDLALREEISSSITEKIDPAELAHSIYPRIEQALLLAKTPEETNEIRGQIEVVKTYIKRSIPKYIKNRWEQFKYTHEGDMLYLRASAQAGALWKVCEYRRPPGVSEFSSESFQRTISSLDAGFKNPRDAVSCERISELDNEDWRTYEMETLTDRKQPTINGAETIWHLLNPKEDTPPLPDGKYRVLYADPPWKYADTGVSASPSYGGVKWHYKPLSIDELCAFTDPGGKSIKDLAADDAVLFMWVTAPMLLRALEVIEAWGFEYKTHIVWDKIKHNYGYYFSMRHEDLLVCGRGSSTPDVHKLYDSVQSIERNEKHSDKPEEFRRIIDELYPTGDRVELFGRHQVDGWVVWGNEAGDE